MLEILQMFLFLFKSKYRRKCAIGWFIVCYTVVFLSAVCEEVKAKCEDSTTCGGNGVCRNETCDCFDGWQGPQCQFCGGKVRLGSASGTIHDGLGNYSVGVKCSWLIDAQNSSITLHLEEFATECGWDHLYVYDGDSVDSPLLAVFSGLMYRKDYRIRRIPEVVAKSGSALLHFFSDDAYNMSGFNLTYRLNACPSQNSRVDCSGHGVCIDGECTCDAKWTGEACHLLKCPQNCWKDLGKGHCDMERHGCICNAGFRGDDCAQLTALGYWEIVSFPPGSFIPPGSASHGAAVWRDSLYIVAGESYSRGSNMYIYDFNGNIWETPHLEGPVSPSPRYAHSTVLYGDKIFLYGGVLGNRGPTSELWAFDISAKNWENVTVKSAPCNTRQMLCGPLKSAGHSATIVSNIHEKKADRMIVIFGHSTTLGYLNTVQEFYFGTREWNIVDTYGFPVKGGYGHSASWDPLTRKIYVYGGVISESESTQVLSNRLYSYEPDTRIWTLLANASSSRFLHSATFVSHGLMLVFGGNTHNDTSHSDGAKCYSSDLLAYDVICDNWQQLSVPLQLQSDLARFGHSAVTFEKSLYIYGGFDGQMLRDMLKYTPGNCSYLNTQSSCLKTLPGLKCVWDHKNGGKCIAITDLSSSLLRANPHELEGVISKCPEENRSSIAYSIIQNAEECTAFTDCVSCVQTTRNCVWCGTVCAREKCKEESSVTPVATLDQCPKDPSSVCRQLHTCPACGSHPSCRWDYERRCRPHIVYNSTEVQDPVTCSRVCSEFTSCNNCTQEECIWCQNEGRCVDKNAYTASFPYGQCLEWTTVSNRCRSRGTKDSSQCSFFATCVHCRNEPACGWCDDGSRTGLGQCLAGGYTGPTLHEHSLPSSTCPPERWHFTTCPACQCNGHASCHANTSVCQPCRDLTMGPHCERCMSGYWGSPVNGGRCMPCDCNGQATQCHPETGKCFCTTKGLAGDHCEKCDATNHYHGDPSNKGFCYYDLTIDYQFTFNLSKKEDRHFTQINFRNSPIKPDVDADFSITCSVMAKMNITIKKANGPEKAILSEHNCTTFRSRFTKADYNFGMEDNVTLTTFYVYVYDFQPPLWIQISFSQYPKLNLQQFFITFSTCFLLLLLVAAILWKIKQRYDMYRRRQRLFVEMEQMASRPFSQVLVEVENRERTDGLLTDTIMKRRKRDSPSPIALEPCCGNRAAVLSLLVRLPTGGECYTPRGQSAGLAVASALVTLGNPRKVSVDQCKATETKLKSRKAQSQHPDSCL